MSVIRDAESSIMLDRKRIMRIDFNSLCAIEEVTGRSVIDSSVFDSPDARTIRALLWACLRDDDPGLSLEDAGRLITVSRLENIIEVLGDIVSKAFGVDENDPTSPAELKEVKRVPETKQTK